jgi:hypothetical protein
VGADTIAFSVCDERERALRRAGVTPLRAAFCLVALATLFGIASAAAYGQEPPAPPQPPTAIADLSVSIARIPAQASSLAPFWFRITTTNKGPQTWGGVIDVDLPPGFQPFFTGGGWVVGGCVPTSGGDATCPAGGLAPGASVVHDMGLRSGQSGPLTVTAAFRSLAPPEFWTDPNPADNAAQLSAVYDAEARPENPARPPGGICTVAFLTTSEYWSPLYTKFLTDAIERIGRRGIERLRSQPRLDNILTCPQGRVVIRVSARRNGRTILLAQRSKSFDYGGIGRSTYALRLTKAGRRILEESRRLRVRVTVRLFDGEGGSVQRARHVTVGKPRPLFG